MSADEVGDSCSSATVPLVFTAVAKVQKLFPQHVDEISQLAVASDEFRSMCEDYELAVLTLERLQARGRTIDSKMIPEYRDLISDLEKDLKDALTSSQRTKSL